MQSVAGQTKADTEGEMRSTATKRDRNADEKVPEDEVGRGLTANQRPGLSDAGAVYWTVARIYYSTISSALPLAWLIVDRFGMDGRAAQSRPSGVSLTLDRLTGHFGQGLGAAVSGLAETELG